MSAPAYFINLFIILYDVNSLPYTNMHNVEKGREINSYVSVIMS